MATEDVDGSNSDYTTHVEAWLTALCCYHLGDLCVELQEVQIKKKKKKTPWWPQLSKCCCHLAGNYLPIRTVDGPTKKKEWQSKIRPRLLRKEKKIEEDGRTHNEACETDTAVGAAERDWDGRAETHPSSASVDANLGAFILGHHCAPF